MHAFPEQRAITLVQAPPPAEAKITPPSVVTPTTVVEYTTSIAEDPGLNETVGPPETDTPPAAYHIGEVGAVALRASAEGSSDNPSASHAPSAPFTEQTPASPPAGGAGGGRVPPDDTLPVGGGEAPDEEPDPGRQQPTVSPAASQEPVSSDVPRSAAHTPETDDASTEGIATPDGSIVANRAHPNQEAVNALTEKVSAGRSITDGWDTIEPSGESSPNRTFMVDSAENPQFFAKVTTVPNDVESKNQPELGVEEVRRAPEIAAVVNTRATQAAVEREGLGSIAYVEPLLAHTDAATGTVTVVYPWQPGQVTEQLRDADTNDIPYPPSEEVIQLDQVVKNLQAVFEAHGLSAEDLNATQLLLRHDENGVIHASLIDAEHTTEIVRYVPPQEYGYTSATHVLVYKAVGRTETVLYTGHPNQTKVKEAADWLQQPLTPAALVEVIGTDVPNTTYATDIEEWPRFLVRNEGAGWVQRGHTTPYGFGEEELERAQQVEEVFESAAARDIAWRYGYTGVVYVRPIAAVTDRERQASTTVYPWPGGEVRALPNSHTIESRRFTAMANELNQLLAAQSIQTAISDLQLMIGTTPYETTYLAVIDTGNQLQDRIGENNTTETMHLPRGTVTANRTFPAQELINRLVDRFNAGALLTGWTQWIKPTPEDVTDIPASPRKTYWVDNEATPTVFAKRWIGGRRGRDELARRELHQAAEIQAIIASAEAQQMVQAQDFEGIAYVPPLIAVHNNATGEDIIVYPWQTGAPAQFDPHHDTWPYRKGSEARRLRDTTDGLYDLLHRYGIVASDLIEAQLLLSPTESGKYYIHLVDAEYFYRRTA